MGKPQSAERIRARTTETEAGCWEWRGKKDRDGYGRTSVRNKSALSHRAMWVLSGRAIPDGLSLDHLCRNRACCNPAHLEPVTQAENRRRANCDATQCRRGHPIDAESTRSGRGHRICRTCVREAARRYRLRRANHP